jgi:CRISPR-associated endonuclease Csn1
MGVKQEVSYTLGLDIGIASVGWCLLGTNSIIALGVRTFDCAESEKGESLNLTRREKRTARKRLRRRAYRLLRTRRLFKLEGLLSCEDADVLCGERTETPWHLRVKGLDSLLTASEWAKALYHLVKLRGFHSTRKSAAIEDDETGRLLEGVADNHKRLIEEKYRTPSELASHHIGFSNHKRNKGGQYTQTFARSDLAGEISQLFEAQRSLGNPHASVSFEKKLLEIFWAQRPALTGEAMLKLLGHCRFEPKEYRAPKRSYSAERFVWLSKLNNIYVVDGGQRRKLSEEEWQSVMDLPFQRSEVKWKTLRTALEKTTGFPDFIKFAGLSYRSDGKNPEDAVLVKCQGWHTLRLAYEKAGLNGAWEALIADKRRLDELGRILSIYKTDNEIQHMLESELFSPAEIAVLLPISFNDFLALSLKAVARLLPLLEQGQRFDEAAGVVYGNHQGKQDMPKTRLLPPIDRNQIKNPVVFRSLNQARKVVNAIVQKYGSPQRVHVELARDLSRPFDERRKITKEQEKFRDLKQELVKQFIELFDREPRADELTKWRLYREQDGQCAYSQTALTANGDVHSVFDIGRTEIDHILPYSRSYDDSLNNKVLVLSVENRNKGNLTPYEYLHGASDSPRWRQFEGWVKANSKYREAKRQRLLRIHFAEREANEFRARNLNDTRYICREFKNLVERNLQLAERSESRRCIVVNGQLTAHLRARWGVLKVREEGDLHHALDAAVVAACGHELVKRLADYSRQGELKGIRTGYTDPETGEIVDIIALRKIEMQFPVPWPAFRTDLLDRLSPIPIRHAPVLVSRAPKRRHGGAAHQETIRSCKRMESEGVSTVKTPLSKLKQVDLERLSGRNDPRNAALYGLIAERLQQFGGDGAKAFAANQPPLHKPCAEGQGNVVRSVTLEKTQISGVPVRQGVADNDTMLRVDLFTKANRYYLVPVYVADKVKTELPNKAIIGAKPENVWDVMDTSYEFLYSIYPNDYLVIKFKNKPDIEGYYGGCDRSTGAINLWTHDRNNAIGKAGLIRGIGVKTALLVEKFHVDVLGQRYPAKKEIRHGLA